jgi:hypothetical protein
MDSREIGVHKGHCCVKHGCKYGEPDCPVVNQVVEQSYTCEECGDEGIKTVAELIKLEDVDKLQEIFSHYDNATEQSNENLLNKILKLIEYEYGYKLK